MAMVDFKTSKDLKMYITCTFVKILTDMAVKHDLSNITNSSELIE